MDDHTTRRRRSALVVSLILALALVGLSSCASMSSAIPSATRRPQTTPGTDKPEVDLTATGFLQSTITITRVNGAATLNFVDLGDGGPHIICTGWDQKCDSHAPGPDILAKLGGITIDSGEVRSIDFTEAGIVRLTCPIHAGMNLTVIVK